MLHVGTTELKQAFNQHCSAHSKCGGNLHLFYAAECGLKVVWMRRKKVWQTRSITSELAVEGHNLMYWAGELRLPRHLLKDPVTFRLQQGDGAYGLELSHQAWRYGARMVTADELLLVAWLTRIVDWVREELSA